MLERLSEMPEVFVSIITGEYIFYGVKTTNYAARGVSKKGKLLRKSNLPKEAETMQNLVKKNLSGQPSYVISAILLL